MASKGKTAAPAKAASDPQIEALQRQLVQEGFLTAKEVDGRMGDSTQKAVAARDAARAAAKASEQADKQLEIEKLKAQSTATTSTADAEAKRLATARQQRYDEQSSSLPGVILQSSANTIAPAAAGIAGLKAGDAVNAYADSGQANRNTALRGAAADRVSGLTTRKGALEGVSRAGAMPSGNSAIRGFSRMAPNLMLGALAAGKGFQLLNSGEKDREFYPEMIDRGAGLAYIGFGSGMAKKGVQYAFSPGVSPDAQALSVINSEGLRRSAVPGQNAMMPDAGPSSPGTPPSAAPSVPEGPRPGTKAALVEQAKALGIKNAPNTNKADLANSIADAIRDQGATRAKRLPKIPGGGGAAALAAGLAYAASPDDAQAASNSGIISGANERALTNAAIAGGLGYGANKILGALPAAGTALAPFAAADLSDSYAMDDQQLARDRNWVARNVPGAGYLPGAVGQAYDMAQVPSRRPNDIPAPEPAPVAQDLPEDDFAAQMADLDSLLQQIGAEQEDGPVRQSIRSQAVAQQPSFIPQNGMMQPAQAQDPYANNRLMMARY